MASNPLSITIPHPSVQVMNPDGSMSRAWIYYMLSLLNRTGGVQGVSSTDIQKQVVSNTVLSAMDDVEYPAPFPSISMESVLADAPDRTSIAAAVLTALAFADDPHPAPVDPILASLLVSDVA